MLVLTSNSRRGKACVGASIAIAIKQKTIQSIYQWVYIFGWAHDFRMDIAHAGDINFNITVKIKRSPSFNREGINTRKGYR